MEPLDDLLGIAANSEQLESPRIKQTFFTVFQQVSDTADVALRHFDLFCNLGSAVASRLEIVDFAEQFQWADPAPRDVLNENSSRSTRQIVVFAFCILGSASDGDGIIARSSFVGRPLWLPTNLSRHSSL